MMKLIPVSIGELIDKLSILHVKKHKISSSEKLQFIEKEFDILYNSSLEFLEKNEINSLYYQLIDTNSQLWEYEDRIRVLDSLSIFEGEFIYIS